MFAKLLGTKSWGFLGQHTWVTSKKTKKGVGFHHIEIRGVKSNKPQQYKLNQTLIEQCVNVMPHQMKGIRDGRQDVHLLFQHT
jgi:hypothetical protein